jgi:hypothetical protein
MYGAMCEETDEVTCDQTDDRVFDFDHIVFNFEERVSTAAIVFVEAVALDYLPYTMTEEVAQIPRSFV